MPYKDRAYAAEVERRRRLEAKISALKALGGVCVVCGWSDSRALQIDHINGDGNQERRDRGRSSFSPTQYQRIVTDKQYRSQFQLLCANHNWVKRFEKEEHYKPVVN